ncbi:pyrroline-5-carboxylate reductase [Calothrix sp. PCC 7507]|uniref:pyrroline-5-carboxylate reductase n=1 Tax=Calothrix sp. PCC 7507 TaxID=99598 RepID=UPI00029F2E83|nr:pyrroline-5-carboxylate reductase [Calothrix sp. PCC 7507]AFY35997.1 pyrroline-5-carboxylate reductase [Calothrix sp. PCC 7507]
MTIKFGLIGGGVMGEALLSRLIVRGIYQPSEVIVSEPQTSRQNFIKQQYNVAVTTDNSLVFEQTKEVIFLAVKPQVFSAIAQELGDITITPDTPLVISILAGVPLVQLEAGFPQFPVIRAMPNTPATVGAGITAICLGAYTHTKHYQIAQQVFSAVGEVVEVPETLMDAVTGLSGSGPAYVALMVEALADGGVAVGLPRTIANQLALQTVLGTAKLLQETKIHPAELKDRVTSPGGTTIAGVAQLEKAAFRSALIEAVKAATERSQELGK